jgi:hypothetical protein
MQSRVRCEADKDGLVRSEKDPEGGNRGSPRGKVTSRVVTAASVVGRSTPLPPVATALMNQFTPNLSTDGS